ncbi:PepSY domain-containing protein [Paenibacillus alba]|uniref:PepSY-associated TM helix domain-containing protein n=1 Tax=Paenibacillus alba TaxID=1197127 RepID=UPI001564D3C8|nr:PepSY domain-containing protein [Paenibacillus alba]NQX66094.1 PepSY domain-containing protein [Paenibacillus alba]
MSIGVELGNGRPQQTKVQNLYAAVWRWHFYAGMIFAPFLVILAVTGGIYVFKPQIESLMYKDYYYVQQGQQQLTVQEQIQKMNAAYPEAKLNKVKPSFAPNRSSEFEVKSEGQSLLIFINPYNGQVLGDLNPDTKLMQYIREFHGKLMIGKTGDRIIELSACWAMILLVTGLYLWWPRGKQSIYGIILPRMNKGKRMFWRDLHAVTAFWLSLFIAALIVTGLPWSGFMGTYLNKAATYPQGMFSFDQRKPESTVPTKDVVKGVPWAAEQLPIPNSAPGANGSISIEQVMDIGKSKGLAPGYQIALPAGEKGVYTLYSTTGDPKQQTTLHIDQYSGNVLADQRFQDFSFMAKAITIGIALHQGEYFGATNQIICLMVCLGIILVAASGVVMWWLRKPEGRVGAPALPKDFKMVKWVALITIGLGIVFPLVGISLLIVLILDGLVLRRLPALKKVLG